MIQAERAASIKSGTAEANGSFRLFVIGELQRGVFLYFSESGAGKLDNTKEACKASAE